MMKWLPVSFLIVGLICITACSGPHSPEGEASAATSGLAKQELDKLQGAWRIESSMWNGAEEPPIAKRVKILFQDDKLIQVDIDGNRKQSKIKLMPEQKPKAIDCWSWDGGGQPAPGIYSLEGDTFKWCSAGGSNKVRPTSFASTPGSKQSLMVLRRETK
jgi:uncharacterized protein (TIGR03067 family)